MADDLPGGSGRPDRHLEAGPEASSASVDGLGPRGPDDPPPRSANPLSCEASALPSQDIVAFPDVIEVTEDAPILLGTALGLDSHADVACEGVRITEINGRDIGTLLPGALPGIRIGGELAGAYVIRRPLDGRLELVPDAGIAGVTSFLFTVADATGDQATLVATLSIMRSAETADISFADGTHRVMVTEGMDAAILGALMLGRVDAGAETVFRVFENDSDCPSARFEVQGDRLKLNAPLDHLTDGTIRLRVVAGDGMRDLADGELIVSVQPAESASLLECAPILPRAAAAPRLVHNAGESLGASDVAGLASNVAALLADEASVDQFRFHALPETTEPIDEQQLDLVLLIEALDCESVPFPPDELVDANDAPDWLLTDADLEEAEALGLAAILKDGDLF